MKRTALATVLIALLGLSAFAEEGPPPRPKDPLVIADFETPADLAKWVDLEHALTDVVRSSGEHAMRFDIPKWDKARGDEPRPGVRLPFNGGRGYPFTDWSAYHAVVIDAWVLGKASGRLGLKLRDSTATNSWTTHIDVAPGKKNEALLLIDDAAADIDITDVQEVVLYSLRPDHAFSLVVDNLRLLPREKPKIATFHLRYPNYRGLIFPEAGDIEVHAEIDAAEYGIKPKHLKFFVTLQSGESQASTEETVHEASERLTLETKKMPAGPGTLTAFLMHRHDKAVLAQHSWRVRKLTEPEVEDLDVYIDRHNNTIVDGKPFFPLGWYSNASAADREAIADSPFNTLLVYGTNRKPKTEMMAYLDALQKDGLKLIYCLNDVYPTATYFEGKDWEGVQGNKPITAAVVKAYRDHPALLAWYLNDEIPRDLKPQLLDYYERVKAGDPTHPAFIVLCQKKDLAHLAPTTDILAGDPYPIPKEPVTRVSEMMLRCQEAMHGAQPIWLVPQAFAWYQHDPDNTDRARIPSEKDLETGRAPTYEEARCMTYLGLVHGAKGLVYWCYYNMRMLPQYEEMWAWMRDIGEEVKTLSPMLLSPDDLGPVPFEPAGAPIGTKLKRHDGRLYLMAVNTSQTKQFATFTFPHRLRKTAQLVFENRGFKPDGKRLSVAFRPLEVLVLDLGKG